MDENILPTIRITADQVGGMRVESHVTTVVTDTGIVAVVISFCSDGIDADPGSSLCGAVMDESVIFAIGIVCNQIAGL
jgi:hypothetical protein